MTGNQLDTIKAGTSTEDLEADIRQTRHELGETVRLLSAKLDVKSQIRNSTDQAKANIKSSANQVRTNAVQVTSSNWREFTLIAVWATVVTLIWKKF